MNVRTVRRFVVLLAVAACVSALVAATAFSAAEAPNVDGVAHHWVTRQMRYAAYTETATAEADAKTAAVAALTVPPESLIAQADRGYPDSQTKLDLAKSLRDASPVVVGHEVLVWNDAKAAKMFVSADGVVKVLGVGTPQQMLATRAEAATDAGDRDAIEIAESTFGVANELDPAVAPATGALVSAHAVGFARPDGTHIVVRADTAGNTSFPDW